MSSNSRLIKKSSAPQGAENASIPKAGEAGPEPLGPKHRKSNLRLKTMAFHSLGMMRIVRYGFLVETCLLTHRA